MDRIPRAVAQEANDRRSGAETPAGASWGFSARRQDWPADATRRQSGLETVDEGSGRAGTQTSRPSADEDLLFACFDWTFSLDGYRDLYGVSVQPRQAADQRTAGGRDHSAVIAAAFLSFIGAPRWDPSGMNL